MNDFDLHTLIREVCDTSTIADPVTLAAEVSRRIDPADERVALDQALPTMVRHIVSLTRGSHSSPGGHCRVENQPPNAAGANHSRKEALAKLGSDLERVRTYDEGHGGEVAFYGKSLAIDEQSAQKAYLTKRQRIAVINDVSLHDYDTFEEFAEEHSNTPQFVSDVAEALEGDVAA